MAGDVLLCVFVFVSHSFAATAAGVKGEENDCADGKSEINAQAKPHAGKQRQFGQTLRQAGGARVDDGGVEAGIGTQVDETDAENTRQIHRARQQHA